MDEPQQTAGDRYGPAEHRKALGRLLDDIEALEPEPDPETDPEPFCEFTGPWG